MSSRWCLLSSELDFREMRNSKNFAWAYKEKSVSYIWIFFVMYVNCLLLNIFSLYLSKIDSYPNTMLSHGKMWPRTVFSVLCCLSHILTFCSTSALFVNCWMLVDAVTQWYLQRLPTTIKGFLISVCNLQLFRPSPTPPHIRAHTRSVFM